MSPVLIPLVVHDGRVPPHTRTPAGLSASHRGGSLAAMKLCFSTLASPQWSLRQIVEGARAAGLAAWTSAAWAARSTSPASPAFDADLDATLAPFREAGLSIPCL